MARTLTAANSILMLSIDGLFAVPQQLQGFAADDIFDTDSVAPAETSMGVDGKLSGGWVPQEIKQNITLQADSRSVDLFEAWYAAQQTARELYYATGSIYMPAVERKYSMVRGILSGAMVTPNAKKILQPRKFTITWQSVSPSVI